MKLVEKLFKAVLHCLLGSNHIKDSLISLPIKSLRHIINMCARALLNSLSHHARSSSHIFYLPNFFVSFKNLLVDTFESCGTGD